MRRYDIGDDIALTRGAWQRDGLIVRWVPDPTLSVVPPRDRGRIDPDAIACDLCYAKVSEHCWTADGRRASKPHNARLIPRHCECGAALRMNAWRCETCRDARQKTNALRYERKRQASRRRSRTAA